MQNLLADRRILLPLLLTAVAIAVGSVLIVLLSDDGSAGGGGSAAAPARTAAVGDVTIDITDFKYALENVTVKAGSKVTWTNHDTAPHTATASDGFDTGNLRKGDSKTLTLKKAGTYAYVCEFHPFMKATVVVQ